MVFVNNLSGRPHPPTPRIKSAVRKRVNYLSKRPLNQWRKPVISRKQFTFSKSAFGIRKRDVSPRHCLCIRRINTLFFLQEPCLYERLGSVFLISSYLYLFPSLKSEVLITKQKGVPRVGCMTRITGRGLLTYLGFTCWWAR